MKTDSIDHRYLTANDVLFERLKRQKLTLPLLSQNGYQDLFEFLQPVAPVYYSYPGSPPGLIFRTVFDNEEYADELRAERKMVKGRFNGNSIGYVLAKDLELYANAFSRPIRRFNATQQSVLEAIKTLGPTSARFIKEETGLLNKKIMPALHRLQEAFIVFEDQVDDSWDRAWSFFDQEWPNIKINEVARRIAMIEVIRRFLKGHVFATFEQIKDWSGFPSKVLVGLLHDMEESGSINLRKIKGLGNGWLLNRDIVSKDKVIKPSVLMLHKADILVKSHASELKRKFGDQEVLQYLLIDGAFQGAVIGHWRINPHDVDDIILTLPSTEQSERKAEILHTIGRQYRSPDSMIKKFSGKILN